MFEVQSFGNAVMNAARKSKFTTADTHRELLALVIGLEKSMCDIGGINPEDAQESTETLIRDCRYLRDQFNAQPKN